MLPIILASQSPRRKQLLQWAEIEFEVIPADIEEIISKNVKPSDVAVQIADDKATVISARYPDRIVLAADTIVVTGNEILGKPQSREEAISHLQKLNGSVHEVVTGVVIRRGEQRTAFSDSTLVEFWKLGEDQLQIYVDKYKPYDKAGAYAIQEWIGVVGIRRIEGDFYNVMGLPVSRVVRALGDFL